MPSAFTRRSARLSAATAPTAHTSAGNDNTSNATRNEPSALHTIIKLQTEDVGSDSLDEEDGESEEGSLRVRCPRLHLFSSCIEKPAKRRKTNKKAEISLHPSSGIAPASKRPAASAKGKSAARSRVQGRLKSIMNMPLDILFEVTPPRRAYGTLSAYNLNLRYSRLYSQLISFH